MIDEIYEILARFGYPVFKQGTVNPAEQFPESFFTWWNYATPEDAFYDNHAHLAVWGFWVYFYSSDPYKTETVIDQARNALVAAGWSPTSRPHDASSGVMTHTGRMFSVEKIETYKEE